MAGASCQTRLECRKSTGTRVYRFLYFSQLLKRPVCAGKIKDRLGKLTDIVFRLAEPYPDAVGIYLEHGWGKPTEFIPWEKVIRIEDDAIFVAPPPDGARSTRRSWTSPAGSWPTST